MFPPFKKSNCFYSVPNFTNIISYLDKVKNFVKSLRYLKSYITDIITLPFQYFKFVIYLKILLIILKRKTSQKIKINNTCIDDEHIVRVVSFLIFISQACISLNNFVFIMFFSFLFFLDTIII